MAIWYILWSFWYIFHVLVYFTKKNLATQMYTRTDLSEAGANPTFLVLLNGALWTDPKMITPGERLSFDISTEMYKKT
jgi:hypothetical protein